MYISLSETLLPGFIFLDKKIQLHVQLINASCIAFKMCFHVSFPSTYPVRVESVKHPGNDDQYVQHQGVLVTQPQTTAQRPPM